MVILSPLLPEILSPQPHHASALPFFQQIEEAYTHYPRQFKSSGSASSHLCLVSGSEVVGVSSPESLQGKGRFPVLLLRIRESCAWFSIWEAAHTRL